MKRLVGLAIAFMFTAITYGQTVEFTDAGSDYDKAATTEFNFNFSNDFTVDAIMKSAANYENYFSTNSVVTKEGIDVTLKLVEDTEMARRVVTRLLVSLEVTEVSADGKNHSVQEFVDTYIMK